ncbi:exodeoxyribonuclease VII large subunit [Candidatus Poribacteria bacterium]|nr:exodeoxyribonuclease VII large subunit [Candidatus Poribacteria bacterium]
MMFPTGKIYKVHEITQILQGILQSDPMLQDLWLEGEISNLGRPSSGHVYFTLKDNNSQIQCAIFRPAASRLRFPMQNGDAVLVNGRLTIYDARSQYQIIGERIVPAGVGELQLAFERLKEQLAKEGLFDPIHKKPLPKFPQKIGLITSATGAAIRDILRMLQKRYPAVEVLLFPTRVQGEDAAAEIAHAIACMNRLPGMDLLIVGRGGGSIEDLWAFNEEVVARAIFASNIPIVSAVGHETDVTIADLVADHRAPTPSAAVENIVPDQDELRQQLAAVRSSLVRSIAGRVDIVRTKLENIQSRIPATHRIDAINRLRQAIDQLDIRGQRAAVQQLGGKRRAWQIAAAQLDTLSPLATLARGYSICKDSSGNTVTDAAQVHVGEEVHLRLSRGQLACRVLKGEIDV